MNTYLLQNNESIIKTDNDNRANQNSITIGTQTEETLNIGKDLGPLGPDRAVNPLKNTQTGETPLLFSGVMNGNFIAEAIKLDNQSARIRKMIINKDWLALKHHSKY